MVKQQEYRDRFEREPVAFVVRELDNLILQARESLARFIHCSADDLVLIPNVTHGVNMVLKSLAFRPGDEVIITNHIYGACRIALNFIREKTGIVIKEVSVEFPVSGFSGITEKILDAVTPNTRLVFIDHITSPTALIFPVREIVETLDKQGIDCLIDGAHAPGGIPLDLEDIGAAYYTGNCHKWMCAPKGVGFLHVRADKQKDIHPLVHSHFSASDRSFTDRFHWSGTLDPSAALCLPDVISFMDSFFPGGWGELMQHNHELIVSARKLICNTLEIPLPCPDEMISTMAAIPIGTSSGTVIPGYNEIDILQEKLYHDHQIEVPVFTWPDNKKRIIRPSAQLYNDISQYRQLVRILHFLL